MISAASIREYLAAAGLEVWLRDGKVFAAGSAHAWGKVMPGLQAAEPEKRPHLPPLTERQRATLDAIRRLIQEKDYPPSVREVGKALGLTSTATAQHHIKALRDKGYLAQETGFRRLRVIA
jgi:biotin operon repressor